MTTANERDAADWQPKLNHAALWAALPIERPKRVAGGYPADLFTRPGGKLAALQFLRDAIPQIMRRHPDGGMPTMAYLFCQNDPIDCDPRPCLYSMQLRDDSKAYSVKGKDFFAFMVRMTGALGGAGAIAMLGEAWSINKETCPPEEIERLQTVNESIANHSHRIEIVWAMLHTRGDETVAAGQSTFKRYSPRSIVYGTWHGEDGLTNRGRFKNIMKPMTAEDFAELDQYASPFGPSP